MNACYDEMASNSIGRDGRLLRKQFHGWSKEKGIEDKEIKKWIKKFNSHDGKWLAKSNDVRKSNVMVAAINTFDNSYKSGAAFKSAFGQLYRDGFKVYNFAQRLRQAGACDALKPGQTILLYDILFFATLMNVTD